MAKDRQGQPGIPERADHGEVRRNNLELVLRHLALLGPASRATIASRAGLTRATVSRLVAELLELGLVKEVGLEQTGATGRPGTSLELDGSHLLAVGAEVNVEKLTVVVTDLTGQPLCQKHLSLDVVGAGPEEAIKKLASACRRNVATVARKHNAAGPPRVAGIGVAVPGLVDVTRGVVTDAPNLRWHEVPLARWLRRRLPWANVPIAVGNDANFAAQAEYWTGPYAGAPNLAYITGDVGIGGGLIVEGKLLLGPRGHAGEVGHMSMDPSGPRCGCGRRGCWEALVGRAAFLATLGASVSSGRPEDAIAKVAEKARSGDSKVLSAIDRLGHWVGLGAANLVNLVGTEVVLLGGYFAELDQWVLPPARAVLRDQIMANDAKDCLLVASSLGFGAAAGGAALQAVDQVLSDPTVLHGWSAGVEAV